MGEVVSIHLARKPHGVAESLERVLVHANYGLNGDWRSHRDRSGQLTLIEAEALEDVARQLGQEIPAGASRRQVVVRGVALNALLGRRLRLGPVLVFVADLCDPCSQMERTIGRGAQAAMEDRGGVRCHVLEGGELQVGDSVTEEVPQHSSVERAIPIP
jgi:MOSC domain-containing protein YiiM